VLVLPSCRLKKAGERLETVVALQIPGGGKRQWVKVEFENRIIVRKGEREMDKVDEFYARWFGRNQLRSNSTA